MASIQELFSYTYLTEMVQRIKPGLPKLLPEELFTVKKQVVGDRVSIPKGVGARDTPRAVPYMSPAVAAKKYDLSLQSTVCMSFNEVMEFGRELVTVYRQWASYGVQDHRAMDLLVYQTENFKKKFDNGRIATVFSLLALDGKVYFDENGNLLPSSSGAALTFDSQVPAGNSGTMGGIFSTWNTGADIPSQVLNFKAYALRQTNFPITHAFYGQGVSGRLANNTSFQYYMARNPQYNQFYKETGQIADGVLGLKWIPVQDAYFVDKNGSAQTLFRTDYITFTPDLGDTYMLIEGSTPIPNDVNQMGTDVESILRGTKEVYGMGSYATAVANPLQLLQYMFDCYAPVITVPESWYWANVG